MTIPAPTPFSLNISEPTYLSQLMTQKFYSDATKFSHWRPKKVNTDGDVENFIESLKSHGYVFSLKSQDWGTWYIFHYPNNESYLAYFEIGFRGNGYGIVGSDDPMKSSKIVFSLLETLPQREQTEDGSLILDYWSMNTASGKGTAYTRRLDPRDWKVSYANYPVAVRNKLQNLMDTTPKDIVGGKLILWHGPPGTGKSNAILALADQWRKWCKAQYVLDPELLFNQTSYMIDVITRNLDDEDDEDYPFNTDEQELANRDKYRLLIIEDAEEFLRKDAKDRSGQGLSRLLNITDGLIGQGMKCLILITTNEDIKNFHEAIIRPGRCLDVIEFSNFDSSEAREWAVYHNMPANSFADLANNVSLASMYARLNGSKRSKVERKVVSTGQYL